MNRIMNLLLAAAVMVPGIAVGALDPLTEVHEVSPEYINMPAHAADAVRIKRCERCDEALYRVNAATVYRLGGPEGEAVDLAALRAAVQRAISVGGLVLVEVDRGSETVVEIVLASI